MPSAFADVMVAIDPTATGAEAARYLLETLGARVSFVNSNPQDGANSGVDIVITRHSPDAGVRNLPPVWIATSERGQPNYSALLDTRTDPSLGFGPIAEMLTAAHTVLVALAALRASRHSGQSTLAHVAMIEVMASSAADLLLPELCHRAPLPRRSAEERTLAIPCSDGAVSVTLTGEEDRSDLAQMIGLEAFPCGSEESPAPSLESWARRLTRDEIVEIGQSWRLPILPVLTREEVAALAPGCASSPFRITGFDASGLLGGRASRPTRSDRAQIGERSPVPRLADKALESGRARRPRSEGAGPLDGMRVLDLGMVWAGPYCGRLLAGLGAEVVKIEGPRRRDGTRPPDDWAGCSGFFGDLNRGKRSLVLDLSVDTGRATFLDLVREVDVVLENFSPRVMPNFGLDYAALSAINPGIIHLSMPAFHSESASAQFVGYGSGFELASSLGIHGDEGQLAPAPVPYLDLLSGVYGAIAIVAAILKRDRNTEGCRIELAQHFIAQHLSAWCPDDLWADRRPRIDPGAVAHDQDLVASGLFTPDIGNSHCQHLARCPWTIEGATQEECPAPRFGADSARVLREVAGMSSHDIEQLILDSVVHVRSGDTSD